MNVAVKGSEDFVDIYLKLMSAVESQLEWNQSPEVWYAVHYQSLNILFSVSIRFLRYLAQYIKSPSYPVHSI